MLAPKAESVCQVDEALVGKAVDSLRILTTGNEANKVSLFSIPSSVASLIRLMGADKPLVRLGIFCHTRPSCADLLQDTLYTQTQE